VLPVWRSIRHEDEFAHSRSPSLTQPCVHTGSTIAVEAHGGCVWASVCMYTLSSLETTGKAMASRGSMADVRPSRSSWLAQLT